MASLTQIIKEISQKIKPGDTSYYVDRNNKLSTNTINDMKNDFERIAKDSKNWGDIINAVYTERGVPYISAPKKGSSTDMTYTVINPKNTKQKAWDVRVRLEKNTLIIEDLMNSRSKTMFEFSSVMDAPVETKTAEDLVVSLVRNINMYKNKSPKELRLFLESVLDTKF
jgi:hypothetical protein